MSTSYESISVYKLWLYVNCRTKANVDKLLDLFGTPENVYSNLKNLASLKRSVISDGVLHALENSNPDSLYNSIGEKALRSGIRLVFCDDRHFPAALRLCNDAPALLYIRGRMFPDRFSAVGIVGTRRYSDHGAELAEAFAYRIASEGVTVVSGMALGIDTISATSAMRSLKAEYPTIAVLGSGVDIPTPSQNKRVYERILECGTIVSQFQPGSMPTKYTYPMRNRIIAGISDALLVIEAGEKSGALITANAAKAYGRPVFAPPARVTDDSFEGSNALLMDGRAEYVMDPKSFVSEAVKRGILTTIRKNTVDFITVREDEIPRDSGIEAPSPGIEAITPEEAAKIKITETLDETDKSIYNALCEHEKSFDELMFLSGLGADELNMRLTMLELKGCIAQRIGRLYTAV